MGSKDEGEQKVIDWRWQKKAAQINKKKEHTVKKANKLNKHPTDNKPKSMKKRKKCKKKKNKIK